MFIYLFLNWNIKIFYFSTFNARYLLTTKYSKIIQRNVESYRPNLKVNQTVTNVARERDQMKVNGNGAKTGRPGPTRSMGLSASCTRRSVRKNSPGSRSRSGKRSPD